MTKIDPDNVLPAYLVAGNRGGPIIGIKRRSRSWCLVRASVYVLVSTTYKLFIFIVFRCLRLLHSSACQHMVWSQTYPRLNVPDIFVLRCGCLKQTRTDIAISSIWYGTTLHDAR